MIQVSRYLLYRINRAFTETTVRAWVNISFELGHNYPDSEPNSLCSYSLMRVCLSEKLEIPAVFGLIWPGLEPRSTAPDHKLLQVILWWYMAINIELKWYELNILVFFNIKIICMVVLDGISYYVVFIEHCLRKSV